MDNQQINNILNELAIYEYNLIGTAGDDKINIDVVSDIDAKEIIIYDNTDISTYKQILKHFQNVYKTYHNNKNIIITDFKNGVEPGNIPIRWNYKSIKKGYIMLDNNRRINFIDCLQQHSTIKIDVIAILPSGIFKEISINYYYIFKNFQTTMPKTYDEIKTDLLNDVYKYKKNNKIYKSIKRLYSYYKISKPKKSIKLIKLINSKEGIISKNINDLELISIIIKNKYFSYNEIITNLKNINNILNDDGLTNLINNKSTLKKIDDYINVIILENTEKINNKLEQKLLNNLKYI